MREPRDAAVVAHPDKSEVSDVDDLARRLAEPVARLLRTELRRGRERAGRPHDGRR
jgi:syndecan 1